MSNDIIIGNSTVVAIQNNPISNEMPTDGYVLTWDATDGYWIDRPTYNTLRKIYFTSSGTWTCPPNITNVIIIAAGGGGSAGGGAGDGGYMYIIY